LVLATLLLAAGVAWAAQPNIIFVLTDDLGWGDLGCFYQNSIGGTKRHVTPNLDSFAAGGVQMRQHYCPAPVCAPSRASFLLGVHQGHANVRDNQFDKAIEDNHTVASTLRRAGYATALIGKYGLQGSGSSPAAWPAYPTKRGFDFFYGYVRHADGHQHYPGNDYPKGNSSAHRSPKEVYENDTEVSAGLDKCYTTDLFTARTKKWIVDHRDANPTQPFFVFLAYDTPHAALQLPTQAYPAGGGLSGGLQWLGTPSNMINTAFGTIDSYYHPDYAGTGWSDGARRFATGVRRIDSCVGDLVETLQDLNIDTNTLVAFSSDNGPHSESYLSGVSYDPREFDSFGIYDGIKRDCWEGGIRVPTLARWPGTLLTGAVVEQPSQFHDWLPTFLDAAGVTPPARSDGVSLLPMLTGTGAQRQPLTYVEYYNGSSTPSYAEFDPSHHGRKRNHMQVIFHEGLKGVRYDIQSHADDFEIYDVAVDPRETNNLASAMPALQLRMKNRVLQIRRPNGSVSRVYDNEYTPSAGNSGSNGLNYAVYEGNWLWVPAFETLAAVTTGRTATVDLTVRTRDDNFGLLFSGYVEAPGSGDYTFTVTSDSGALLRIHEATVVDDDYNHDGAARSGTIRLARGLHPIRIAYFHTNGAHTLDVEYSGPGIARQIVPASAFTVNATGTVQASSNYVWGGAGSVATPVDWDSAGNADPSRWDNAAAPDLSRHTVKIPSGGIRATDTLTLSSTGSITMTGGYLYLVDKGIHVADASALFALRGGHVDAQWLTPDAVGTFELAAGFVKLRGANEPIAAAATGYIDFTGDTGVLRLPNKDSAYLAGKLAAGRIRIDGLVPGGVGPTNTVNGRYFDNDIGVACVLVEAGSYRETVLSSNHPRTYLMLDECAGAAHAVDSSGYDAHGSDATGVQFGMTGIAGAAAAFDGSARIVTELGMNPNAGDFSIEMFVNTTSSAKQNTAAQQDGTGQGRSLILVEDYSPRSFYGGKTTQSGGQLVSGRWHHLVMVVDDNGGTDTIAFYIDGEVTPGGGTVTGEDADGAWVFGVHKQLSGNPYYGMLDEIAVYDRALTPEEVRAHYARSRLAPSGTVLMVE